MMTSDTPAVAVVRRLLAQHGATLLFLAGASIRNGLRLGEELELNPEDYPEELRAFGAAFVTLKRDGALRGCIGSLQGWRPLVADIAENAFNSAFRDSRFAALAIAELPGLEMSLSVLTAPEPMAITGEADLLAQLRPHEDGLILTEGGRRGLFLPSVWEIVPEPASFVQQLKRKAGLPVDYWSPTLKAARFRAVSTSSADLPDPSAVWADAG